MNLKQLIVIFVLFLYGEYSSTAEIYVNDDVTEMVNFVKHLNYPIEVHEIVSEDEYILTTLRIPFGKRNIPINTRGNETNNRPIVFLMHGLLGSCFDYIVGGPEKGLAFLLVDNGFDVWLGNARGSIASRRHVYLNPDTNQTFWDFSWNEIGYYDLPANMDYILNYTQTDNNGSGGEIIYIGASQGAASFFVMASEKPRYNKNVKVMLALAPAVFLSGVPKYIRDVTEHVDTIQGIFKIFGIYEIFPKVFSNIQRLFVQSFCQYGSMFQDLCVIVHFSSMGLDLKQFNKELMPLYLKFCTNGISTKQLFHYMQVINSEGSFVKYDYGPAENIARYGSAKPPKYNLDKVSSPVAIFYGPKDVFASDQDVTKLTESLPNVIMVHKIPYKDFVHYDYVAAVDVVDLLYNKIISLLINKFVT